VLKFRQQKVDESIVLLEARVTLLLSQLGLEHVTPRFCGRASPDMVAPRLWVSRGAEGDLWGVRFERNGEKMSRRSLYLLAGTLKGMPDGFRLQLGVEIAPPGDEALFQLWSEDSQMRGILAVCGLPPLLPLPAEGGGQVASQQARAVTALRLMLELEPTLPTLLLKSECKIPWGNSLMLVDESTQWTARAEPALQVNTSAEQGLLTKSVSKIKLLLKELHMSENTNVNLTLEMGTLEIPLQDFLRIRVGHALECDLPQGTSGYLRMGGRTIAAVAVGIEEQGLSIRIEELFNSPSETQLLPSRSDKEESTFTGVSYEFSSQSLDARSPS
jgi:flagellar motor switch/type III secretory pathway protein FliN